MGTKCKWVAASDKVALHACLKQVHILGVMEHVQQDLPLLLQVQALALGPAAAGRAAAPLVGRSRLRPSLAHASHGVSLARG